MKHAATIFTIVLASTVGSLLVSQPTVQAQTTPPEIIAYGDSLIEGLGVASSLTLPGQLDRLMGDEYDILNRGQNGAETEILLNNLQDRVLNENPDIVILYGGGADLVPDFDNDGTVPAEETFANLESMITQMQDAGITVVLLGHGSYDIPGFTLVDYTDEFEDLADNTDVYFVPDAIDEIVLEREYTINDRLHPNARGYSVVTLRTFPVLQEAIYEEFPDSALSGSCQVDTGEINRPELVYDDEETIMTNQTVEWTAFAVGGFGDYEYSWEIDGETTKEGREVSTSFETEGERTAEFTVRSSDGNAMREDTIQCDQTVNVVTPPLKGACTVEMDIDDDEVDITWDSDIAGGEDEDEYEYEWEIDGAVVSTEDDFRQTYDRDDTGVKSATLSVQSGPHDATLTCSVEIPDEDQAVTTSALDSVSCDINGFDFEIGDTVRWEADVAPFFRENDEGDNVATTSITWDGSQGLSATGTEAQIAYNSSGIKTAQANIDAATGEETFVSCEAKIVPDTDGETAGGDGDDCFIATAAYGTTLASELNVLRDFRDEVLLETRLGTGLVNLYYTISPPVADVIEESKILQQATRLLLEPVVASVKIARSF